MSCRYIRNQINAGAVKREVPLTTFERAALDFLDEQTRRPDLRLDMDLQAGDIQFINNYTILHSRTGFVDGPEPRPEAAHAAALAEVPEGVAAQRGVPDPHGVQAVEGHPGPGGGGAVGPYSPSPASCRGSSGTRLSWQPYACGVSSITVCSGIGRYGHRSRGTPWKYA